MSLWRIGKLPDLLRIVVELASLFIVVYVLATCLVSPCSISVA